MKYIVIVLLWIGSLVLVFNFGASRNDAVENIQVVAGVEAKEYLKNQQNKEQPRSEFSFAGEKTEINLDDYIVHGIDTNGTGIYDLANDFHEYVPFPVYVDTRFILTKRVYRSLRKITFKDYVEIILREAKADPWYPEGFTHKLTIKDNALYIEAVKLDGDKND